MSGRFGLQVMGAMRSEGEMTEETIPEVVSFDSQSNIWLLLTS